MLKIAEKQQLVDELHEKFLKSKIVIVTDYKGLNVTKINELRKKLREADLEFKVVKNTLLIRAADETDVAVVKDHFQGPSAIVMSYGDPVNPAKILFDFAKDNDKLQIKAGAMGGKLLDMAAIKSLSTLPSREVLLSQVLRTMNAVPTSLVRALSNVPERFLYALQAIRDQKEAA